MATGEEKASHSCMTCGSTSVHRVGGGPVHRRNSYREDRYFCDSCGATAPRVLTVDDSIECWQDREGNYWHRTAGVFVRNTRDEFLFFERSRFPSGFTVPAGHVSVGEAPETAARRELAEETGLTGSTIEAVGVTDMVGDGCRRGVDRHVWHTYLQNVRGTPDVEICEEGFSPVWLPLGKALALPLTMPVRSLITSCAGRLLAPRPE